MQMRHVAAILSIGLASLLLRGSPAQAAVATIEDFSSGSIASYTEYGGNVAPAGSTRQPGWEVGGRYFQFEDVNGDRMLSSASNWGGLDIGIKLAATSNEYQPVWDAAQASEALDFTNVEQLQFQLVNRSGLTGTTSDTFAVTMYFFDTSNGTTATVQLFSCHNGTAWTASEVKTFAVDVASLAGFDNTADKVYGFRLAPSWVRINYNGGQIGLTSITCTVTSDGLPAPNAVTNLGSSTVLPRSLTLTWTAPADATGFIDNVASYDIRYSEASIDESNWDAATQVAGEPTASLAGAAQTCDVSGLTASTAYFFALKSTDNFGNVSALSNNYQVTTAPPDVTAPAAIMNLSDVVFRVAGATLSWTAPGDDGSTGTAASYDLRYATFPITEASWDTATQATGAPAPKAGGSAETFTVLGLLPDTEYYFAIKTADEWPNVSAISNVCSVRMPVADTLPPHSDDRSGRE